AAVFTFGSLGIPFEPGNWRAALALYAVSSFITALLLVFGLILTRTMLRLWAERSKEQLGARFKTKMVVGAMALSLLHVLFWFLDKQGKVLRGGVVCDVQPDDRSGPVCGRSGIFGNPVRTLPSGVEIWEAQGKDYLVARVSTEIAGKTVGYVAAGYRTSPDFL